MADNVGIATGTDATVATDDVGGVHYQVIKLDAGADGASARVGGDAANGLDVDVTRVQGTVATSASGAVAHDAADSGNPVKTGARARSSAVAAVASDDRVDTIADLTGKTIVRPHCLPEETISGVNSATTTGNTSVIAAQAAGVRLYVTTVSVANTSTTNTVVEIKDGTTVVWRVACPGGGGANLTFDPPLRLTAATALQMATLNAVTTAYFSANGYTGA